MIFSGGLCGKVLDGSKTQTRRPVRDPWPCQYKVGKTYAVQPGRGKHALGRVRILDVMRVPVQPISDTDALAEGFDGRGGFTDRWLSFYGNLDGDCWRIEFELAPPGVGGGEG